ncbi:MAG: NAD(P)H-binding protein [Deltaproteobacteria bacterium]|nr:NAD(P)H-binding protein [Deltaproteobacteria bacterium]
MNAAHAGRERSDGASERRRVLLAGATGYIGRHVARALVAHGEEVVCLARARSGVGGAADEDATRRALEGCDVHFVELTDPSSLHAVLEGATFDAVVSCIASRSGTPSDAWRVDHDANVSLLDAATRAGAKHFVLLSAICVQKPRLEFQRAKLAFEERLRTSGLRWSIVRPTAFFKSLSGQVEAVKRGKPFLVFGDGTLTSCKPISERDLARFVVSCLDDPSKHDAILPIGGPGEAITPLAQGAMLAELCGRTPRYRHVPVRMLDAIIGALSLVGRLSGAVREKAELARIGRYYATESMLVYDAARDAYDAAATPSFGHDTLRQFYAHALEHGLGDQQLGDHAVFSRARE